MENLGLHLLLVIWTLICVISYACMTLTRRARLLSRFPCPGKFPIVGSIPYMLGPIDDVAIRFENLIKKFGKRVVLWFGPKPIPVVILAEADGAQKVLSSVKYIDKGLIYSEFKWLLGTGLLTSSGQLWKDDRKLLGPSFNYQKLTGFLPSFNKQSRTLVEILTKLPYQATNLYPLLARATMDLISESALALDTNYQVNGNDNEYLAATNMALDSLQLKFARPWLALSPFIWDRFGLGKQDKICLNFFNQAMSESIEKRKVALALGEKTMSETDQNYSIQKPFIDVLLDSKSEKDIMHHILTIFGGGFETTASAMNYTLFLLAVNSSAQEKVQIELDSIFEDDINRDVTLGDLSDMKYLEMCIKEALRIYPPVPIIGRNAQEDIPLDNGQIVPKGSQVFIIIREILRDPLHFPHPEVFNPDRFLPDECTARHPYAYIPFSAGPRNCLGMKYAMIQMKACLAHILRRFHVSTNQKPEDISLLYRAVLTPKPKLEIVLTSK
ncbi:cytochrome P450 4c3 [Folsomia candida]|uniref:cytochrome P450 4c3 n=1 Tax=Folsomia candida TaxID=158441 RepID=UPI000B908669|nr:cytochrome P450 4c3 [Folsomia candida]